MNGYTLSVDLSEYESLNIGILSDTHGILNQDVEAFVNQCDIILHAGDIMDAKILGMLKPVLGKSYSVKGNNDIPSVWHDDDRAKLDEIPDTVSLRLPGGTLIMEHGHRVWDRETKVMHQNLRVSHPDAQLVVYGHTHIRMVDDSASPMLANPGAAGEVRVQDGPSCLSLKVNNDKWEIEEHVFPLV